MELGDRRGVAFGMAGGAGLAPDAEGAQQRMAHAANRHRLAEVAPEPAPEAPAEPLHFDRSQALSRVNGNLELLKRFIKLFIERNGSAPADIARSVEAGDLEGAKRTAHMLKGSAGTVGLIVVQGIAARLEGLLQQQLTTPDDAFQDNYRPLAAELAQAWERGLDAITHLS